MLNFVCKTCTAGGSSKAPMEIEMILSDDFSLDCVDEFCYLGDMIGASGGARSTSIARVRRAWKKFRELLPLLVGGSRSLKKKGQIYRA